MPTYEEDTAGTLATTGTTVTANYPATVNAGDFILGVFWQKGESGSSAGTWTTPTGFTAGPTSAVDWNGHYGSFYDASAAGTEDGGTYTSTTSRTITSNTANSVTIRVSNHGGLDSFASAQAVGVAASNQWAGPSLTPSVDNCLVLSILMMTWDGSTPSLTQPSGFTDQGFVPASPGFNVMIAVASLQQTTAAAVTSPTWAGLPNTYGAAAITVAIAPSGGGGTLLKHTGTSGGMQILAGGLNA